jgi:hypothetical protein
MHIAGTEHDIVRHPLRITGLDQNLTLAPTGGVPAWPCRCPRPCGPRSETGQRLHSPEISSASHFFAATAVTCSNRPAFFAADPNSFGGPNGPRRGSTGRRPRRLRNDGLGREPLGLDQGVPDELQLPAQNSPSLHGAPAGSPAAVNRHHVARLLRIAACASRSPSATPARHA